MKEVYEYVYSLAELIWGVTTSDQNDECSIEISNSKGFELLIDTFYAGNGINVKLELFRNGLIQKEEVLDGGSFNRLESFLFNTLNPDSFLPDDFSIRNDRIINYEDFVGNEFRLTGYSGRNISSFSNFIEDQEIENILDEIPEVALDK